MVVVSLFPLFSSLNLLQIDTYKMLLYCYLREPSALVVDDKFVVFCGTLLVGAVVVLSLIIHK